MVNCGIGAALMIVCFLCSPTHLIQDEHTQGVGDQVRVYDLTQNLWALLHQIESQEGP